MRAFALLFCFALVACAGGKIPGAQSEPFAAATGPDTTPPASAAARSAAAHTTGAGPRGGASTAARAPAPSTATDDNPDAPTPTGDPLTQARADCWMKTEKLKMRDIDARAVFVDKCVTEVMKTGRRP
jgi:hypothetical protein